MDNRQLQAQLDAEYGPIPIECHRGTCTHYRCGIQRSIRTAGPNTPHSIEDGYHILRIRLDELAAQDFARTARRTMLDGYSESESVAAHWWAYQ